MAVKYKGNKNRKFTEKETTMQVLNYDESICIVFSNMPRTAAREIGVDLVSAMICRDFALEWNGETELWLHDVDYGILSGFGEGDGLPSLVKELCEDQGYHILEEPS